MRVSEVGEMRGAGVPQRPGPLGGLVHTSGGRGGAATALRASSLCFGRSGLRSQQQPFAVSSYTF